MTRALIVSLLLTACGPAPDPDAGSAPDACAPRTCEALGAECGAIDDGCGAPLSCGACAVHETCGLVTANRCAGECTSDADCRAGESCDRGTATCTSECRTGTSAAIDIPAQRVSLEVTLNGGPLPPDRAALVTFERLDEGVRYPGSQVDLYEDLPESRRAPRDGIVVTLAPGRYAARLDAGGGAGLPPALRMSFATFDVDEDTTSVALDILSVPTLVRATLGGAPLPMLVDPSPGATLPELLLVAPEDPQSRAGLGVPLYDGTSPRHEQTLALVPGTYDVFYSAGRMDGVPLGHFVPIARGIEVGVSGSLDLDIPVADVDLTVTVNGAPAPLGRASFVLRGPVDSRGYDRTSLRIEDGSARVWLIPGRHDVQFLGAVSGSPGWPEFSHGVGELDVGSSGAYTIDVPTVTVDVRLGFDRPIDVTDAQCVGYVRFDEVGHDPTFPSFGTLAPGAASPIDHRVTVVPGRYETHFIVDSACIDAAPRRVLGTGVSFGELLFDGASPVEIVIPVHRVALSTRPGGEAPEVDELEIGERPAHWLVGSPTEPHYAQLLPMNADVWAIAAPLVFEYTPPEADRQIGGWPMSFGRVLETEIGADGPLVIDLPRTRVDVAITLGGRALGSLDDEPVYPWDFASFAAGLYWSGWSRWRLHAGTEALSDRSWWVLPGRHDLSYAKLSGWQVNAESSYPPPPISLGCWDVPVTD